MFKPFLIILLNTIFISIVYPQNFNFNFNSNGQRVCLAESQYDNGTGKIKVLLTDHASNTNKLTDIYRRIPCGNGSDWSIVASNLPAGTAEWIDLNTVAGSVYEYQVKRKNSWTYNSVLYDATGYTMGCALSDNSNYQGQMILLVANNISSGLAIKYERLKTELTGEGWKVNEIIVNKATGWENGADIAVVKSAIIQVYQNAPPDDKPKLLFILGHVPMPRSGSTTVTAPDAHDQNKGARGCDAYYADIDGIYTDVSTFNPGGLQTSLAINLPNDYKWDQDFLPSNVEMGFGRVDFEGITDYNEGELILIERYLDKLSNYRNVAQGWDMGNKTAFNFGYNNSNDASYRNLPNLSNSNQVTENTSSLAHPLWVKQNGPFMVYMQNEVAPEISEWNANGMDAAIYTSDQSYWGYNDVPQSNTVYSRIRALPASNTKCIAALWTTAGANLFYQACTGEPVGLALKEVINHNTTNNKIERPPQQWDTNEWWNRIHFTLNGDPTIRLYQIPPASNLTLDFISGQAKLIWQAPTTGTGYSYNIYFSSTQFGKYNLVNNVPVTSLNYTLTNYQPGGWYMVRPLKTVASGCGNFIQPGLGIFTHSDIVLGTDAISIILKAEAQNRNVRLHWIVDKKVVVKEFVIEHSEDGQLYDIIGTIKKSVNNYEYDFTHFNVAAKINYYRIRELLENGSYHYSNIAKTNNSESDEARCFPNPTSGILTITSYFKIVELNVSDALGRIVFSGKYEPSTIINLETSEFPSGSYFISIAGPGHKLKISFVKS